MSVVAFYVWDPKKLSPVFLCCYVYKKVDVDKVRSIFSRMYFIREWRAVLKDFKTSARNYLALETNKLKITAINNLIGVVVVGVERQEHELSIFLGLSKDERRTACIMRHCCTN